MRLLRRGASSGNEKRPGRCNPAEAVTLSTTSHCDSRWSQRSATRLSQSQQRWSESGRVSPLCHPPRKILPVKSARNQALQALASLGVQSVPLVRLRACRSSAAGFLGHLLRASCCQRRSFALIAGITQARFQFWMNSLTSAFAKTVLGSVSQHIEKTRFSKFTSQEGIHGVNYAFPLARCTSQTKKA